MVHSWSGALLGFRSSWLQIGPTFEDMLGKNGYFYQLFLHYSGKKLPSFMNLDL